MVADASALDIPKKHCYGLGGKPPLTQRETAQLCRISRSYVSRIEKRALEKLQAAFSREMAGE